MKHSTEFKKITLQINMSNRFLAAHLQLLTGLVDQELIDKDDANREYLAFKEVIDLISAARDRRITVQDMIHEIKKAPIASIFQPGKNKLMEMV